MPGRTTQNFTIAVTNAAPRSPRHQAGANTVSEDVANGATVGITAGFDDVNGGTVTYSLADNAGGRFAINAATGVVTVADANQISFEGSSFHTISVRASDGTNLSTAQSFTITVTNVPPVAAGDSYVTEDGTLNVPAPGTLGNDSDVHGGAITAVLDTGPANAASFTLNADGSFSYAPNANFNGADSFTYHPSDGTAAGNIVTVSITVTEVNDAPDRRRRRARQQSPRTAASAPSRSPT